MTRAMEYIPGTDILTYNSLNHAEKGDPHPQYIRKFGASSENTEFAGAMNALVARARAGEVVLIGFLGSSTTAMGTYIEHVNRSLAQSANHVPNYVMRFKNGYETIYKSGITPGIHLVNMGISGSLSRTYITQDLANQINRNFDAVVHMVGSNDFFYGVSRDDYSRQMRTSINMLHRENLVHLLYSVFPRFDSTTAIELWTQYREWLYTYASTKKNFSFLDSMPAWDALRFNEGDPWDLISSDNVHPNSLGHQVHSRLFLRYLGIPFFTDNWVHSDEPDFASSGWSLGSGGSFTLDLRTDGTFIHGRFQMKFGSGASTGSYMALRIPSVVGPLGGYIFGHVGNGVWSSSTGTTRVPLTFFKRTGLDIGIEAQGLENKTVPVPSGYAAEGAFLSGSILVPVS